ncbi:MAG TPA: hypothetical protein VNE82_12380 [Candidatus Binataceae bacterium]|nr:hypothetical protein [Candidatus Binataceae bacterium]
MAVNERAPQSIDGISSGPSSIEFGPPVADRAALESVPGAGTVKFYLLTEAANRAWAAISASVASGAGAVFWIGGPAGAGKTHFLNYLLALEERAGTTKGRRAIVRLALEERGGAYDLEQRMFERLAREIGAGDAGAMLWRRLHGGEALGVAFEQAYRVGIRGISVAMDFGATEAAAWDDYFAELARVAACDRRIAFNVYVAARTRAPASALALEVAPAGGEERMLAALARARGVVDETAAAALYNGADLGGFRAGAIFPFDPLAIETLRALAGEPASVAALAKLVSAALAVHRENAAGGRGWPLLPVDLMAAAAVAKRVEERLGEAGRAALKIAHRAADTMEERGYARAIVDALMLERLGGGGRALAPGELRARLPERYRRRGSAPATGAAIATMLEALAACTGGVIAFAGREGQFNPRAAGAPEVAAFNGALALLQRFDSSLGEAAELPELRTKLKRASDAMARAVEAAHRAGATLEAAHREMRAELKPEDLRALEDFAALAGAGADALVEQAAEPQSRARAERVIAAYEALAAAAAAAPRLREMREYLRATALTPDIAESVAGDIVVEDSATDKAVAAAQVECQLLAAAFDSGVLRWESRGFDALEIRFQKFKWNYIQLYQAAHARWRRESERMALELADAREHCGALGRLNSIAALGPPVGDALAARIEELGRRVARCAPDAPITLDLLPRCPRCGFVLGGALPASELGEVFEEMRRALKTKLAALSHDAIARLICQHDRGHRLDGFLKITQAAHTDALVRVLDDNLARYLGRLLDEVQDEAQDEAPGVLDPFARARRDGLRSDKRAGRAIKQPPE